MFNNAFDNVSATTIDEMAQKNKRRSTPASISFVPSCAGLIIAGEVVRELLYGKDKKTDSSGI